MRAELTPGPRARHNVATLPSASQRAALILLAFAIVLCLMAGCGGTSEGGRPQSASGGERTAQNAARSDFRAQRIHERKEDAEAEVQDAEEEGE